LKNADFDNVPGSLLHCFREEYKKTPIEGKCLVSLECIGLCSLVIFRFNKKPLKGFKHAIDGDYFDSSKIFQFKKMAVS